MMVVPRTSLDDGNVVLSNSARVFCIKSPMPCFPLFSVVATASDTFLSPTTNYLAGVAGLEPAPKVLETSMLTIDTIPLCRISNSEYRIKNLFHSIFDIQNSLFVFSMQLVLAATTAELVEFEPVRRILFVLCSHVVALFALCALQNNVISRHKSLSGR